MDFEIDDALQREARVAFAQRGRRPRHDPLGLEADRQGRPIPVEDPYFAKLIERGEGQHPLAGARRRPQEEEEAEARRVSPARAGTDSP